MHETPAMESRFISSPDVGFRLETWKPEKGKNIMLVTGLSGSGKSTFAKNLAKRPNHMHIELDWYDHYKNFAHPENPGWVLFVNCFRELTDRDTWSDLDAVTRLDVFERGWTLFKEKCAKTPSTLYIVEGIQVVTLIHRCAKSRGGNDPKTMPLVVKGTSAYTSVKRARNRCPAAYPQNFVSQVVEWMGYDKRNRKFMAEMLASGTPQDPADFGLYD